MSASGNRMPREALIAAVAGIGLTLGGSALAYAYFLQVANEKKNPYGNAALSPQQQSQSLSGMIRVDAALAPVVQELRSCPAANELLVQVCSQQRTVHKRALRVRCMPNSFTGKYQPNGSWDPVSSAISVRCENNSKVQIGTLLFELLNAKENDKYEALKLRKDTGYYKCREDFAVAMEGMEYTIMGQHHEIAQACWPHHMDASCCPRCPSMCTQEIDSYRCCLECGPCKSFTDYYRLANTTARPGEDHPDDCHAGIYRRRWDRRCSIGGQR